MRININELRLSELKDVYRELRGLFNEDAKMPSLLSKEPKKRMIGEYCIIRCGDAGVHAGYVEDWYDRTVILKDSRRLWYWKCKTGHSLSGLATGGLHSDSELPCTINEIVLTDACEIIPTSSQFEEDCKNAPIYNP